MSTHAVPRIDFAPFLKGDARDRRAVARTIDAACTGTGFFAIAGHGVGEDAIAALRAEAVRFFALPAADKQAVARPDSRASRGWYRPEERALAYSLGIETPPDLQESFAMGPPEVPQMPYFTCARARMFFAPNRWPAAQPGLRAAMSAYFAAMEPLARALMHAFALARDLPEDFFEDKIDRHTSSLRLIRYPGAVAPGAGQLRAGAHTDYGTLTILRGDNLPGGLEVKPRGGAWTEIVRPEGAFICNIGDAMARWTNDRWVSTLHRVGVPPGGAPSADRIAIAFFHNPNYDADIAGIPAAGQVAKYPTQSFDSYYLDKLRRGSLGRPG